MILSDDEIINSLILNNKDKLIDRVPALTDEQKQQAKDFFKKYSNYENKIDWNKLKSLTWKDFEDVFELASQSKSAKKANVRGLFADKNFVIVNEDDNFIYASPLDYEGAKFCDSYDCGGQGAKWCIGWTQSSRFWKDYTQHGDVFCMIMTKPNAQVSLYDMFSGEGKTHEVTIPESSTNLSKYEYENILNYSPIKVGMNVSKPKIYTKVYLTRMDKTDNKVMCQIHDDGKVDVWSQVKDARILEYRTIEEINSLGFDIPADVYDVVRPEFERVKQESRNGVDDVRSNALRELLEEDVDVDTVELVDGETHLYSASNGTRHSEYLVLTEDESRELAIETLKTRIRNEGGDGYDWDALPSRHFPWDYVDHDCFDEWADEDYRFHWDDMSEDEKIDALINLNYNHGKYCCSVCEDEEYFELDENGDVDLTKPKFNVEDYESDYVDSWKYDYSSSLDYHYEMFGKRETIENVPLDAFDFDGYADYYTRNEEGYFDACILDRYSDYGHDVVGVDGTTYYIYER